MRRSTQHNYENRSSMTQKEVIKWGVHLEAIEKALKGPYVTVTQEV